MKAMKHLFTLLFIGFLSLSAQAQNSGAKIEFKETTIDYGTIEKGADGVRVFEFTNTGNAPLVISKAYSTCGCTVPSPPKDPIAPGESGVIKVKYDTNRSPGPIRKTITVYTNASAEPYTLKIKGTLLPATN